MILPVNRDNVVLTQHHPGLLTVDAQKVEPQSALNNVQQLDIVMQVRASDIIFFPAVITVKLTIWYDYFITPFLILPFHAEYPFMSPIFPLLSLILYTICVIMSIVL